MESQIIVNDQLISYLKSGPENAAKNLVFLHGWRSQKEVWNQVISQLSIINCQLFVLDLPGFGKSPVPEKPFTIGDYADLVKGFIEKMELKNVILVGHSFGGRVGIKLAAAKPNLINKLVLVDSAGFVMQSPKKKFASAVAKIAKPFFQPQAMQGLRKKIYQKIGSEDYLATPELQKTFINVVSEDLSVDMKKISCPTLIIWGENDKETPVEFGKKMNSLIPNSKYTILNNAGHFSFLDQPEGFVKELEDFITSSNSRE